MEHDDWMDKYVKIGKMNGIDVEVTLGQIFMAGIEKDDLLNMINAAPKEVAEDLIFRRDDAGNLFKEMNISTRRATQILINIGEIDYQAGIRDAYAVYAHKKLSSKTKYFKFIFIAIVIFAIYKLIN